MNDNNLESSVALTRLADVKPERVEWLWSGWLPRGKPVTLDGDPGLGKSTLALEFTATVTAGGAWPDGTRCDYPGAVLLMSAEDGLADTVRPRLDAAGADVTRVHAIEGVPTIDESGEVVLRPPTLADVSAVEEAIIHTDARLLIVDVIMAYLPSGTDSHRDQDVRRVLSRLASVADRTGCTVLLLRHLNKAKGGDPLYRGGGSIGIVGAARAGMLVAADPDDPERRVLASVKSNLGPPPESQAYGSSMLARTVSPACSGKVAPTTPHGHSSPTMATATMKTVARSMTGSPPTCKRTAAQPTPATSSATANSRASPRTSSRRPANG